MEDARALLTLLRSGAPAAILRRLLEAAGSASALLADDRSALRAAGLRADCLARIEHPDLRQLDADLAWLQAPARHLIGWHSPDYPSLLRAGSHPPAGLFVLGDPDLLWHPQVSVVGSRRPSAGGRENALQFARAFGRSGLVVTSGLASGVDTAAHLGALESSRTIAVLGTGPDQCYPTANAGLMRRIAETGTVVTEHPPGTPAKVQHFPSRNRLVAALSLGTVVIEAGLRSGALITARLAADAGREVFALPGSIHNPMARGCHRLIRQGAGLAESPDEVIEALGPLAGSLAGTLRGRLELALGGASAESARALALLEDRRSVAAMSPGERLIWRSLCHDPVNLDQLCERTGLTVGPLSAMLLAMELDGKISAAHGRYSRRS